MARTPGGERLLLTGGCRGVGSTSEREQVLTLGGVQPEGTRDRAEYLGRDVDRAALFEPGVPGDPDPGERGDLLAAQPWSVAPPGARQPGHLGGLALGAGLLGALFFGLAGRYGWGAATG